MAQELAVTFFPDAQAGAEPRVAPRAALRVSNLTKYFDNDLILDDVSFSVVEGESLVLLGPSGSGKSTTLRLLAGLASPDSGEIYLRGRHIEHLRARERNIGVIFQHYALFPRMTVAENIAFGLRIRGVKKARRNEVSERLLALIGLSELRDRTPGQLSGGQQQRVAIARALAYEPDLLLFDESFSALDPQTRVGLRREIRALLRRLRIPAIFITHDQEEAMELGDHIAILNRGRLEQVGSPDEVYNNPQTEFVATFLGAANVIDGRCRGGLIELDCERCLPSLGFVAQTSEEKVKVIFRPEDITLGTAPGLAETQYHLGRAEVLDVSFTGATETLMLRLLAEGRAQEHGGCSVTIKVMRTKWEARRLKLAAGDLVSAWLKSYKILRG